MRRRNSRAAFLVLKILKRKIIAAGGFEPDTAEAIVDKGDADLVTFGHYLISNPDLPLRINRLVNTIGNANH